MPSRPAARKQVTDFIAVPTAGYPRDYARNTPVLVEDVHAWLIRDELGFYAVDALCPHLGGLVLLEAEFICICHGSTFAPDGRVTAGLAQRPLRYLRVELDTGGKLIIQRHQPVSPDDRFIA